MCANHLMLCYEMSCYIMSHHVMISVGPNNGPERLSKLSVVTVM